METANIRAPFTQTRKITEKRRKNTKHELQIIPKWLQNGAQSGPKTTQKALRTQKHELILNSSIFGRSGAPKWTPKITPESIKTDFEALFGSLKKPWFLRELYSRFFSISEAPKPWKSSQNAVLYAKIVGRHFLIKVHMFSENLSKKSLPMHLKTQKIHEKRLPHPSWNTLKKMTITKKNQNYFLGTWEIPTIFC